MTKLNMLAICTLLVFLTPQRSVVADEATLENVQQELLAIKQSEGTVNDKHFRDITQVHGNALTTEERRAAWQFLGEQQNADISREDLAAVIRTKRESIADYHVKYRVQHVNSLAAVEAEDVELASAGSRLLLRVKYTMRQDAKGALTPIEMAFDGKVDRRMVPQYGGKTLPHAAIQPLNAKMREKYAQATSNPIVASMLADSTAILGREHGGLDLVVFLNTADTIIFQGSFDIDGVDCLLAADQSQRTWLDPARDFCVVQMDQYVFRKRQPVLNCSVKFDDLVDYGNGIWLPNRVQRNFFDPETGQLKLASTISVNEIEVNQGLADDLFVNIIPDGTMVMDGVQKVSYVEGNERSIEEAFGRAIPPPQPKGRWMFWLVVIGNGTLIGCYVCTVWWRNRRRNRAVQES